MDIQFLSGQDQHSTKSFHLSCPKAKGQIFLLYRQKPSPLLVSLALHPLPYNRHQELKFCEV